MSGEGSRDHKFKKKIKKEGKGEGFEQATNKTTIK